MTKIILRYFNRLLPGRLLAGLFAFLFLSNLIPSLAQAAATEVFYSVGQINTDLKTGSPTCTLTAGTALFSTAQTGNIGVGDRVTYGQISILSFADQGAGTVRLTTSSNHGFQTNDYISIAGTVNYNGTYQIVSTGANFLDITHAYAAEAGGVSKYAANIAYIAGKISPTQWQLKDPKGGIPTDRTGPVTVNSLRHEYTSLAAAITGAKDANHLQTSDLTTANVSLNIPCYYDTGADTSSVTISGYVTSAANYIKVYTPVSTLIEANKSQRHQGKWDDTKYKLVKTSDWGTGIVIGADYVRVVGLQVDATQINTYGITVGNGSSKDTSYRLVAENIVRNSSGAATGRGIEFNANQTLVVANNLVYGFGYAGVRTQIYDAYSKFVIYNNTVINNSGRGFSLRPHLTNTEIYLKNNIAQDNGIQDYDVWLTASGNNISKDATSPNAAYQNKSVAFVDAANKDYHLLPTDTAARNAGADLSADSYFAFVNDLDGQSRNNLWDIGADETLTPIYRSVGPNSTTALDTGSNLGGNSLTITGNTAVFALPLPENVGVGDVIQYDSDNNGTIDALAFISSRISADQYLVAAADGALPTGVLNDEDWAVFRAYTSLANAEKGVENTGINPALRNFDDWTAGGDAAADDVGKNLFAANQQWNILCYANGTTVDSSLVTVDGWTTSAFNYLSIYTPVSTSEVGVSQRHSGKWDNAKYALGGTVLPLSLFDDHVRVEGLQINPVRSTAGSSLGVLISLINSGSDLRLTGNILKGSFSSVVPSGTGIFVNDVDARVKISNNIIYDFIGSTPEGFYGINGSGSNYVYAYNNTLVANGVGLYSVRYAKNNLANQNAVDYTGTFDSSAGNNISQDETSPNADYRNKTVSFSDMAGDDFHLSPADTTARGIGIDLSEDVSLAVDTDIDGERRTVPWDIGADNPPPVVTAAPAGGLYSSVQSVSLSSNEAGIIYYTTDGATPTTASAVYSTPIPVTADTTLKFFAQDSIGNSSAVFTENYLIDLIPPTVSITSPTTGTTNDDTPVLTYVYSDGAVEVKVDGIVVQKVSGESLNHLEDGSHIVRVTVVDAAGNSAFAEVEFTVDTTPPTVPEPVTGVTLNKTNTTILKGSSETLTAAITPINAADFTFTWSTDNPDVATVVAGVVYAVDTGTANITVTTGVYSAACTVTVVNQTVPVSGIALNKTAIQLTAGNSDILTASVMPIDATNQSVNWSTDNAAVVAVNNGVITALKPGIAVVTVTTVDGAYSAACTVTVNRRHKHSHKPPLPVPLPGEPPAVKIKTEFASQPESLINQIMSDVVPGHWAYENIHSAVGQGIFKGSSKGFEPNRAITRIEFISAVLNTIDTSQITAQPTIYQDAAEIPAWAQGNVELAAALGLTDGYPDGTFRPNELITRAEAAVIISRLTILAKLEEPSASTISWGDELPEWALDSINRTSGLKLINGFPDGTFAPLQKINRAETCTILIRLIEANKPENPLTN